LNAKSEVLNAKSEVEKESLEQIFELPISVELRNGVDSKSSEHNKAVNSSVSKEVPSDAKMTKISKEIDSLLHINFISSNYYMLGYTKTENTLWIVYTGLEKLPDKLLNSLQDLAAKYSVEIEIRDKLPGF
jgi:hypothetical protein